MIIPPIKGFPCDLAGKEFACNEGNLGLIPGFRRSPGEGKGYPLQYSGLENSMYCIVHGVTKSRKQLNDFCFHRTVDAFAFNCYSISRKEQDVWSFIYSSPHSFLSEDNEIIESLTKRLNRTELETVFWTCDLSLLFTIGFLTSLEEFSFSAVLSDHDRWKYFKESLQIKYSYIVHKHLILLQRYKRNSPPWWIVIYFS